MTLEQRRAADSVPELSESEIRVKQSAEIYSIPMNMATPGTCFVVLGILKSDILTKGEQNGNEIDFIIDRRSSILYSSVPFSLEDDILIRAIKRSDGSYTYTANYTGEYSTTDTVEIQAFDQINDAGEALIAIVCRVYQYSYNIQDKIVTDDLEFLYDGIEFDYDNRLAGFDVYYKQTTGSSWKKADLASYYIMVTTSALFYDSNDSNVIRIYNNTQLNINVNATIRVEIKETLGTEGNITITNADSATFSIYKDSSYNYSGVNVLVNMLPITTEGTDGDQLSDIKARMIDAKTRRDNITTEHDIISFINDIDANVQIVKKRNDYQDRLYYMYTLIRYGDNQIAPATTKRLNIYGIVDSNNIGDFDWYDSVTNRKIIRAYSKFKLNVVTGSSDSDFVTKVPLGTNISDGFYLTCPYMMLIDQNSITSYYFTSVDDSILMSLKSIENSYSYQMICRNLAFYRDSHDPTKYNTYDITITGTLNTANDSEFIDSSNNIIDSNSILCYVVFNRDNSPAAYMKIPISSYNSNTREFTFTSSMKTNDFITEQELLQITDGLYTAGTANAYTSVIDYKDAQLQVYFMYYLPNSATSYPKTDNIFNIISPVDSANYVPMCAYQNNTNNLYNLILEFNKFSRSPTTVTQESSGQYLYSIREVPFFEFSFGEQYTASLYSTFKNLITTYSAMLKLTTDFEVSLKFIATYGASKYITVTGGRDTNGQEITVDLADLNPVFHFKVYGVNPSISDIRTYIYEYLRDTYITDNTVFMSNICTGVEHSFSSIRSIKYMGVNDLDASYQEFTYTEPTVTSLDIITRYIPEQFNVTDIEITIDES